MLAPQQNEPGLNARGRRGRGQHGLDADLEEAPPMSGDPKPANDAGGAGEAKWFPTVGIETSGGGVRALQQFSSRTCPRT